MLSLLIKQSLNSALIARESIISRDLIEEKSSVERNVIKIIAVEIKRLKSAIIL